MGAADESLGVAFGDPPPRPYLKEKGTAWEMDAVVGNLLRRNLSACGDSPVMDRQKTCGSGAV